ncbi:MAG: DUF2971 domain-containing protein [Acidiphilium sp.]|nr:DUF2971 domain-containing protein [Acidiphilium sp.]MDD4934429.1 DUF2971 domain-containing protein [Acidiphilium sp.]
MINDSEHFYRFRSTHALLDGWQELEKQEIYFASPNELNDPMEGFKDIFWSGDAIIWRNLIRHYLLCFTRKVMLILLMGEAYHPDYANNIIFSSSTNHPSVEFKNTFDEICKLFFDSEIDKMPSLLSISEHPVRREEIKFYLRGMHGAATNCIFSVFATKGLVTASVDKFNPNTLIGGQTINGLFRVIQESIRCHGDQERKSMNLLFEAADHINRAFVSSRYFTATNVRDQIWHTEIADFPAEYVESLEKILFCEWYAACFVSNPNHAAMWGNYGDGHKGACLKFSNKLSNGQPGLKMNRITGWGSNGQETIKHYGEVFHDFLKINYVDRFAEIDFFRSIGRISVMALNADWYNGQDGKRSSCSDSTFRNIEEGRLEYWKRFQSILATKLSDWQHENEYRLVLYSSLGGFEDPSDRKLTYQFSDLTGIIFGIKTPVLEKKRIVDIIRRKCVETGRQDFEFFQAYYSAENGKICNIKQSF